MDIMYRIVTALVWTNSLKCPQTKEAFIGSRAQPETISASEVPKGISVS